MAQCARQGAKEACQHFLEVDFEVANDAARGLHQLVKVLLLDLEMDEPPVPGLGGQTGL